LSGGHRQPQRQVAIIKSVTDANNSEKAPKKNGFENELAFFCPMVTIAFPMLAAKASRKGINICCNFIGERV